MRNSFKTLSFLILALIMVSTSAMAFPGAAPSANTAPQAAPAALQGTVVETMDSGGYTYLCIENGGQKIWAAVPKTEVKVGQQVQLAPGMFMNQFTSKTLGRTFDSIYFAGGLAVAQPAPAASK